MKDYGVAAIIKQNNKFLLLKESRKLMEGKWGPSHGVCEEKDKTEENTIIREVYEDTSLKVKPIKKVWTTTADTKVSIIHFWLVKIVKGKVNIEKSNKSSEFGWFTVDETLNLDLYPATKKFFTLVKDGKIDI